MRIDIMKRPSRLALVETLMGHMEDMEIPYSLSDDYDTRWVLALGDGRPMDFKWDALMLRPEFYGSSCTTVVDYRKMRRVCIQSGTRKGVAFINVLIETNSTDVFIMIENTIDITLPLM